MMLAIMIVIACKKDKVELSAFEKITYQTVLDVDVPFSDENITVKSETPEGGLPRDAIVFYKTNEGHLGKILIVDATLGSNSTLTIDFVTYKNDGNVLKSGKNVVLALSEGYDLDAGVKYEDINADSDFFWGTPNTVDFKILLLDTALFYVYPI